MARAEIDREARPGPGPARRALFSDIVAGTSVALVLIPQSLAYASVAGLPPERGLLAAILPPIVGGLLASSRYLQTGPTAITALLTFGALSAVAAPGSPAFIQLAATLALLVGAARIAIGLLRFGNVAYVMSQTVVVGFTSAAALLIIASQVPAALGAAGTSDNPLLSALTALGEPGAWSPPALGVTGALLLIVLAARRLNPLLPGALVGLVGAALLSPLAGYPDPVVGPLTLDLSVRLDGDPASLLPLVAPAFVIALVGFAEPAAIARRYAAADRERWDPNREFIAQGAANVVAGLSGAFPVGGSFSRTALGRLAGARSRWAAAVTSLTVVALLPFIGVLAPLPVAALSGVVIAAVLSLVDVSGFLYYWRVARLQFAVAFATFAATLAFAPHVEYGVMLGVAAAVGAHLWRESRIHAGAWVEGSALHLRPRGVLYFGSAPRLEQVVLQRLSEHPEARRIVVHLDGLGRVDVTGAIVLKQLLQDVRDAGLDVEICDVPVQVSRIVTRVLEDTTLITPSTLDRQPDPGRAGAVRGPS